MMQYQKKLVMIFKDAGGRKRKITGKHFMDGLDPELLKAHLNQLPSLELVVNPAKPERRLVSCEHVYIEEELKNSLFRNKL